jgi:non-specific serine/threonine protein kinase
VQKGKSRESANLWVALDWAKTNAADRGLGLAVELAEFEFSDHARTKNALLELLDRSRTTGALRAKALNLAARLVLRLGDHDLGRSLADSSVSLGRQIGDPELVAYLVRGAGLIYHTLGDRDTAAAMYDEALSLLKDSPNRRLVVEVKNALAVLAIETGDQATAHALLVECVAYSRARGDDPTLARYLESMANAQFGLGEVDAAASTWHESLSIFREINDPFGAIWCLGGLAMVASRQGDEDRATRLASAADRMSREWSLTTGSFRLDQLAEVIQHARTKLGARRADAARSGGQAMPEVRVFDYALSAETPSAPAAEAGPLTRREREVVAMVAAGLTNKEIAERLFISERTAEGHVERIRNKLGVRSRTEVATWAVSKGIGPRNLDKPTPTSTV